MKQVILLLRAWYWEIKTYKVWIEYGSQDELFKITNSHRKAAHKDAMLGYIHVKVENF